MIYGIGVDLVNIKRIERSIQRWGYRFVRKIFTFDEEAICSSRPFPPSAFALRFAAKEAFSKAIGLGMKKGLRWKDIEVFAYQGGRPGLKLYGASEEIYRALGLTGVYLSLSDEKEYAVATVVLEKDLK